MLVVVQVRSPTLGRVASGASTAAEPVSHPTPAIRSVARVGLAGDPPADMQSTLTWSGIVLVLAVLFVAIAPGTAVSASTGRSTPSAVTRGHAVPYVVAQRPYVPDV